MQKFLLCECGEKWKDLAPLILRLASGFIFIVHGYMKFNQGIKGIGGFLGSLGFPLPEVFAVILITVEFVGGAFLVLGLFTHWVAKLQAIIAFLAIILVHLENGFWVQNGGYEFALLLFAVSSALVLLGGGRWSLDHYLFKKKETMT